MNPKLERMENARKDYGIVLHQPKVKNRIYTKLANPKQLCPAKSWCVKQILISAGTIWGQLCHQHMGL